MVMGITTTLIGVLPSYGQIGNWAPLLLLLLRLIQGFGAGAEFAGAAMLAVEFSPPQRRGFHGSWSQIGVAIGLAFAVGTFWLAGTFRNRTSCRGSGASHSWPVRSSSSSVCGSVSKSHEAFERR